MPRPQRAPTHAARRLRWLWPLAAVSALLTGCGAATAHQPASAAAATPTPTARPDARRPPGASLPSATLRDLEGKPYTLAGAPGRVLVLDFMSSWCQTCTEALPGVQRLATRWHKRGVRVWVVSTDEDRADLEAVLKRVPVSLPVVLDSAEAWFKHFKLASVPTAILIDPAGQVVATVNEPPGKASYEDAIDAALQRVVKAP